MADDMFWDLSTPPLYKTWSGESCSKTSNSKVPTDELPPWLRAKFDSVVCGIIRILYSP